VSEGKVREWLSQAVDVISSVDTDEVCGVLRELEQVHESGGTLFVCGNGGSASTASHFALDLQKAGRRADALLPNVVGLSNNVGLSTAWGNDESFDVVFSEQLRGAAKSGDALLVISVSGSSPNLIRAIQTANEMGLRTLGFLGKDGGECASLLDGSVIVRSNDYGWAESAHVVLLHLVTYQFASTPSDRSAQKTHGAQN
jgi:D-sedoheptulose 7-phosphate isomerase